jgi:hypothetical protein
MARQGMPLGEIAANMGSSRRRVSRWLSDARRNGHADLPYAITSAHATNVLLNCRDKRAAPGMGFIGAELRRHPAEAGHRLLQHLSPEDTTIAALVVRLALERVNDPRR